jgi:sugar/nucleoside kinase (ribokinase family)
LDDPDGAPLAGLVERARAAGIHTSLDVVHDSTARWRRVVPALAFTDLFIPSLAEVIGITGLSDPAAAAAALRRMGVRFAIVTDGPRGAWVDHDDFVGHIPAFKVNTIDTTGAGDSFTGGVLTGLIHGLGAEEAARLGAAMGALATTTIGTFSGPADRSLPWHMAGLEPPR